MSARAGSSYGVLPHLLWALGCSPYLGRAAVDAPASEPPPLVCGSIDGACDPFTDRGCSGGLRCLVTSLLPPTFACARAGLRRLGESCDATTEANACVAGLQCLSGQCLTLCCARDDGRCRAQSPGSTCAVITDSTGLLGCTVAGECAYQPADTCPVDQQCYPQGSEGRTVCWDHGDAGVGGSCMVNSQCERGLACLPGRGVFGECQPVCNPLGSPRCARGTCEPFNNRSPGDYGVCRP